MGQGALDTDRPTLGLWLRIGSILAFSGMAVCVKRAAADYPQCHILGWIEELAPWSSRFSSRFQ